jgi:ABC-type multidrug transport system fused ATPase/permease subunit
LFTALLRLAELDEGKILIDGVDVSKIGLFDLRWNR